MAKIGNVRKVRLQDLTPYAKNARIHDEKQVDAIAESISRFGFISPVLADASGNVIAGHGRIMAAEKLGMKEVPVVNVEGMSDEERRAYILADNRLAEMGTWDMDTVTEELKDLQLDGFDLELTGFEIPEGSGDWFQDRERWMQGKQEGNDEYNAFVEKFEQKHTTDDCYTPDNVYDAVADWVAKEYSLDRKNFVRPFYPGGDYEAETYGPDAVVVDNPPFSILAKIFRFYIENGIKFFLFAPTLTLFSADSPEICHIAAECDITYENGACVNTSFKTNLEDGIALRTAPELTYAVMEADAENTKSGQNLLKYAYPDCVVTAAKVSAWSGWGIDFKVPRVAVKKITELDAMKERKLSIFGGGFLLSDLEAAKAAKAAKAAQEAGIPIEDINEDGEVVWKLSEREHEVIAELNAAQQAEN